MLQYSSFINFLNKCSVFIIIINIILENGCLSACLIDISNNLGDTKSLITHPETTTHNRLNEKEKKELGITKNLIRLSVGLEDPEDIIEDNDNSLENLK